MSHVDLHCHSTASDGALAPAEVVRLAKEAGLSAIALTDHDTVAGIRPAAMAAASLSIDFVPGIEISAEYPSPGTLHLLGYGIDPDSPALLDLTRRLVEGRDDRNPRIIARLQELGVSVTMAEVEAQSGGGVIGRPHIAAVLLRKGYVTSIKMAFDKYLAPGGLAYFDKERLNPADAIAMIRSSGGLTVLAHATQLRTANDAELDRVVKNLVDQGLAGMEVIHSDFDAAWVEKCSALVKRYDLLESGGSDFHGSHKPGVGLGIANGRRVPRVFFDRLIERLRSRVTPALDARHVSQPRPIG